MAYAAAIVTATAAAVTSYEATLASMMAYAAVSRADFATQAALILLVMLVLLRWQRPVLSVRERLTLRR